MGCKKINDDSLQKRRMIVHLCIFSSIQFNFAKSTYKTNFNIPLVGTQMIELNLDTRTDASIQLSGIVNSKGRIFYKMDSNGTFLFTLDESLENVMARYRCNILDAKFEPNIDEAHIHLHMRPLRLHKHLTLKKVQGSH